MLRLTDLTIASVFLPLRCVRQERIFSSSQMRVLKLCGRPFRLVPLICGILDAVLFFLSSRRLVVPRSHVTGHHDRCQNSELGPVGEGVGRRGVNGGRMGVARRRQRQSCPLQRARKAL